MNVQAPAVAAVTLSREGGGVAVVADLLWRVMHQQFGRRAQLITLLPAGHATPTFADKVGFGARIAQAQVIGRTDWILFSHLALAKAHDRVPRRLRCGYGIFLHGIEAWCALSDREKRLLAEADLRVANSAFTAERVMREHPDIGPVVDCPLALPPLARVASGSNAAASAVPDVGPHAVLVVGRMSAGERYKGHDQVIEAWPQVIHAVPDARLVIVGDGDDRARLQQKSAAGPAAASIVFTGFIEQPILDALFDRAAVFALPSRGEGFGLVYLEAMAHRLPCIGSLHDAAVDVIADGVTGKLVDQADVSGIAATVSALLLDPTLRRTMGDAGHARLLGEFSFDRFSHRITALIASVQPKRAALAMA